MSGYYTRTVVGMLLVLVVLAAAALLANTLAGNAKGRHAVVLALDRRERGRQETEQARLAALEAAMRPVRRFATAWSGVARLPEKNAAEQIRSRIETIAQRQLGLVTDNAITPEVERYPFQGRPVPVQRVTLRASGQDLPALVIWLGKVEETYPAAVIESCDFSANVGGNTGLTVRLAQPLQDRTPQGRLAPGSVPGLSPGSIIAAGWLRYVPDRLKAPIPIGFERNPLQPAVPVSRGKLPLGREGGDEIAAALRSAITGRIRSVIHGTAALVVIGGRIFRVGDEIVLGPARERPLPDARTKLKEIDGDSLIFHVSRATAGRAREYEVVYPLPAFLIAR